MYGLAGPWKASVRISKPDPSQLGTVSSNWANGSCVWMDGTSVTIQHLCPRNHK